MPKMSREGRFGSRFLTVAIALVTTAATVTACAPSAENTADDASLTLTVSAPPPSLDPAQLDNGSSAMIWNAIYDTLIYVDEEGKLQPNAAEEWSYSADALTLTFTLRDDLTYSTGEAVTAQDVKDTLERTKATPGQQQPRLAAVESFEAPDDATVVLHLSTPDPTLLGNLGQGLGVIGDPVTMADEAAALNPVGSGPYTLDADKSATGTTYVLERRSDYWNVDAYPYSTVTIRVIADTSAAFNALQSGQVDANTILANQVAQVESSGKKTKLIKALGVAGVNFIDRTGPLADVKVRQAINMAFDRDAIVDKILGGAGGATTQIFPPATGAYDPELDSIYPHDVDKALTLMAEAGYADGFDVTMPSTFLSTNYEPTITQSLSDIGIRVTWEAVPPQDVASSVASQKYPMVFFITGVNNPAVVLADYFGTDGLLNPANYTDPTLTDLMTKVAGELDQQKADEIYQQIGAHIVDEALNATLFQVGTYWGLDSDVEYRGNGAGNTPNIRSFVPAS